MVLDKATLLGLLEKRHSVRRFSSLPLDNDERERLYSLLSDLNQRGNTRLEAFVDEPSAFDCPAAKFMRFKHARNYVAFYVKKDDKAALVDAGEVGALLSLSLLYMGFGNCFVAGTFSRKQSHAKPKDGETLPFVLVFGHGENEGKPHRNKKPTDLSKDYDGAPEWFQKGIEAIMLCPSSINRFPYVFSLENGEAVGHPRGDSLSLVDIGIAKFFFELASEGHPLAVKILK